MNKDDIQYQLNDVYKTVKDIDRDAYRKKNNQKDLIVDLSQQVMNLVRIVSVVVAEL